MAGIEEYAEPMAFRITIPEEFEQELVAAVKEASLENAGILKAAGANNRESELQFDPITIAAGMYVGNLVLSAAVGVGIEEVIRSCIRRIKERRGEAHEGYTITVTTPDARTIVIHPGDETRVEVDLAALKPPAA